MSTTLLARTDEYLGRVQAAEGDAVAGLDRKVIMAALWTITVHQRAMLDRIVWVAGVRLLQEWESRGTSM